MKSGTLRSSPRLNKSLLNAQANFSQVEADRSGTSRFLEELGFAAAGLPKEIAQGTARSVAGLTLAATKGKEATIDPSNNRFSSAIFGNQEFNLQKEGGDFLSMFGASEETIGKYGLATGAFVGLIDFVPGGRSATSLSRVSKSVAKTNDVGTIAKNLRVVLNGDEESIQGLASTLKNISDPREAQKLISEAGASTRGSSVPELGNAIRDSGVTRDKFLADIKRGAAQPNTRQGQNALNITARLRRSGLTPEAFYDGIVAKTPLRRSPVPDRVSRAVVGNTTKTAKKSVAESTLLRNQIKTFNRGFKSGQKPLRTELRSARSLIKSESGKAARQATKLQKTIGDAKTKNVRENIKRDNLVRTRLKENIQVGLTKYITDNLPVSLRGSLLKKIKNTKTPRQFSKAMDDVEKKINTYNEARVLRKELGNRRSKLAFINKLGELNSTAVRDIKQELGISKPLRQMNKTELDSMVTEAKARFKFKKEQGLVSPKIKDADGKIVDKPKAEQPLVVPDDVAQKLNNLPKDGRFSRMLVNSKEMITSARETVGVWSTELKNISPLLFSAVRTYDVKLGRIISHDLNFAESFRVALKKAKMSSEDFRLFKYSLLNGNRTTTLNLAKHYGFEKEFVDLVKVKDEIYQRALQQNFDIGFTKNHYPRVIKTDSDSVKKLLAYFNKSDKFNDIEIAWREKEQILGRPLKDAERAQVASNLFRGSKGKIVSLSETGSMKGRVLDDVPPELVDLYEDPIAAITNYITEVNTRIETKKFLGGELPGLNKADDGNVSMENIFSTYIEKMQKNGLRLTSDEVDKVIDLMSARFASGTMNAWGEVTKNLGYATLMGSSHTSVVSQLPDLTWAIMEAGIKTPGSILNGAFGRSSGMAKEFGITRLSAEMEGAKWSAKLVDSSFKMIGLQQFDTMLKNTTLDASLTSIAAKSAKRDKDFVAQVELFAKTGAFDGRSASEVLTKAAKGVIDDDIKFLAAARLADFQPIFRSEMPVQYLRFGNGKIIYQMMSFWTKQMDIFRREGYHEIVRGMKEKDKSRVAKGVYTITKMTALLVAMNATADEIKDWMLGRESDQSFGDRLKENVIKTYFGINRYQWDKANRDGVFTSLFGGQVSPPVFSVAEATVKDIKDALDQDKEMPAKDLRSLRYVPGAGGIYYWHFGRGETQSQEAQVSTPTTRSTNRSTSRSTTRQRETTR